MMTRLVDCNTPPPTMGNLYYLRLLLTKQKGCMGYSCLRSINGRKYDTFKEACYALGLLSDDKEFIDLITDAN
jgi:hypothetical protein